MINSVPFTARPRFYIHSEVPSHILPFFWLTLCSYTKQLDHDEDVDDENVDDDDVDDEGDDDHDENDDNDNDDDDGDVDDLCDD